MIVPDDRRALRGRAALGSGRHPRGELRDGRDTWQTIYKVLLPAAKIGIIDAIILGMGRAIGETMAVLMVVGNAPVFPQGLAKPMSTLTTQIVMDMPYATGAAPHGAVRRWPSCCSCSRWRSWPSVRLISRLGSDIDAR